MNFLSKFQAVEDVTQDNPSTFNKKFSRRTLSRIPEIVNSINFDAGSSVEGDLKPRLNFTGSLYEILEELAFNDDFPAAVKKKFFVEKEKTNSSSKF